MENPNPEGPELRLIVLALQSYSEFYNRISMGKTELMINNWFSRTDNLEHNSFINWGVPMMFLATNHKVFICIQDGKSCKQDVSYHYKVTALPWYRHHIQIWKVKVEKTHSYFLIKYVYVKAYKCIEIFIVLAIKRL